MEDEWEEEEQLVVVELSGIINSDQLCRGPCKILDIDSERPMMQIGQYLFAGDYEEALGTCVLFEEVQKKGKVSSSPDLKYMCHTVKKLMMQRIFLSEKKEGETTTAEEEDLEQNETSFLSDLEQNENAQEVFEETMDQTDLEESLVG